MLKTFVSSWENQPATLLVASHIAPAIKHSFSIEKKNAYAGHGGAQYASTGQGPPNITWQGGQVINNPQVYNVFVGDWSSVADQARAAKLNLFMQDLLKSSWMSILAQYGCTNPGKFVKGIFIPNPVTNNSGTSNIYSDSGIGNLIQNSIAGGLLPEPSGLGNNNVYFIYLPDSASISDSSLGITMCNAAGNNSFGYHHYLITNEGNQCYYAVIPGLSDDCLRKTCANDSSCSLSLSQTQEQRQTQVISHEMAEVITNPEANGGWYDVDTGMEVGDICNGEPVALVVGNNSWSVQQIYSKASNSCVASSTATADLTRGTASTLLSDINNRYNIFGGGLGMAAAVAWAAHKQVGIIGFSIYGLLGFIGGFIITDLGKKQLSQVQANKIKLQLKRIGI